MKSNIWWHRQFYFWRNWQCGAVMQLWKTLKLFIFGKIQCDVTTHLISASWSHFILMASQKCFLRPACVFIPASEEEGGVFFCCSKLMLHNHRQQVIPSDRPNAWRRINQPRESIQNYNLRHRFPIRTGWMCLDEIIGKTQNNIHWIQNVPPLIYRNSREYMSWGPVRRFTSYWEPQTLRDFSKTRHTLSHKVQFIFSVKHRTQNAAKNSSRRTHGGQSWAQHLSNEKFPDWSFQRGLRRWQNTGAAGKHEKNNTQTKQKRWRTGFQLPLERMMRPWSAAEVRQLPGRLVFFSPCRHLVVESDIASGEGKPTKWGRQKVFPGQRGAPSQWDWRRSRISARKTLPLLIFCSTPVRVIV